MRRSDEVLVLIFYAIIGVWCAVLLYAAGIGIQLTTQLIGEVLS